MLGLLGDFSHAKTYQNYLISFDPNMLEAIKPRTGRVMWRHLSVTYGILTSKQCTQTERGMTMVIRLKSSLNEMGVSNKVNHSNEITTYF